MRQPTMVLSLWSLVLTGVIMTTGTVGQLTVTEGSSLCCTFSRVMIKLQREKVGCQLWMKSQMKSSS